MSDERQSEPKRVNVDSLADRLDLNLQTRETPEDAQHRRWKDRILFVVAVLLVTATFVAALGAVFLGTPEQREAAIPILTLIVGGFVGYLTGKNAR